LTTRDDDGDCDDCSIPCLFCMDDTTSLKRSRVTDTTSFTWEWMDREEEECWECPPPRCRWLADDMLIVNENGLEFHRRPRNATAMVQPTGLIGFRQSLGEGLLGNRHGLDD
jgi:hypothetical protein